IVPSPLRLKPSATLPPPRCHPDDSSEDDAASTQPLASSTLGDSAASSRYAARRSRSGSDHKGLGDGLGGGGDNEEEALDFLSDISDSDLSAIMTASIMGSQSDISLADPANAGGPGDLSASYPREDIVSGRGGGGGGGGIRSPGGKAWAATCPHLDVVEDVRVVETRGAGAAAEEAARRSRSSPKR
ncbi:unnamed protein product, partial [Scytosiphon promiscuus]